MNGPSAILPDTTTIQASTIGQLPLLSCLSCKAQEACIFPKLKNESLLYVGQLCDNDCTAIFNDGKVHIYKNEDVIITPTQLPLLSVNQNTRDSIVIKLLT